MARVVAGLVVLLVVFGAGVVTGRAVFLPQADGGTQGRDQMPTRGSQQRPIAMGEEADIGPWRLRVDGVVLDATTRVLAANQFNTPPGEDIAFVLVDVAVRRRALGSDVLRGGVVPALTTPVGRAYRLGTDCGVLPAPLDPLQPLDEGEELQGQWCWAVAIHDVAKITLQVEGAASNAVWFALR